MRGALHGRTPVSIGQPFSAPRAAIGFSLANDRFALDRLSKKFHNKIVKTRDADSFVLITRPIKSKDVNFRNLAKEIAATDTLDAFMKEFQSRYNSSIDGARTTSQSSRDGQG